MAMATTVEASFVAALRMGNGWDVNRELFHPRGPTNMQRQLFLVQHVSGKPSLPRAGRVLRV